MKLTNYDRDAFVSSLMRDVPSIDYDEQAASICKAWAIERLPAQVAHVYKDFPGWIDNKRVSTPSPLSDVWVPTLESVRNTSSEHPDLWAKLKVLAEASDVQDSARRSLRDKVRGVIAACSTLKQAKDRLPEFEKYLPYDRAGQPLMNAPAVENLVDDLLTAGWPKASNAETLVEAA